MLGTYFQGYSQVTINPHPVGGFQVASDDVLQFDVINPIPDENGILVHFFIQIMDPNGKRIVHMQSGKHTVTKGINSYNVSNLNIISKRFYNQEIANYESKTRSLPTGNYTYCINIVCNEGSERCKKFDIQENNQTECHDFEVMPMSPLLLSMPEDEDVLKEKRPNFTWIPPMPLGSDPDISYEMTLVHLNNEQSAEDGIRRNRPIFQRDGIKAVNQIFPTTLEDLEEGEHYAWQVQAHLGSTVAATSEVWEFEIEKEEIYSSFVNVNKGVNGIHSCNNILKFSYDSRIEESLLNYRIEDDFGKDVTPDKDFIVERGINELTLSVEESGLEVGEKYHLIIVSPRNERFELSFIYQKN